MSSATASRLLGSRYGADDYSRLLLPRAEWRWFPPASDRAAWEALATHPLHAWRKDWLRDQAAAALGQPWPALPLAAYLDYSRNGDRSRFESAYFERRLRLAWLVLAECVEHDGSRLDEIANGIWAICEETTWCVPAHAARLPGDPLHRLDLESVDIFAAETAMTLATTLGLLRAELGRLSPTLVERISREVARRVLGPFESSDDFGRSGWLSGRNNWAPWCASNLLGAAFHLVDDPARLGRLTARLAWVADRFIDRYGADGGCDEGPGYWNEAAGALLIFLELLHSRTNGAIELYAEPKIAAMGEFVVHAHLAGPWFANFSDCDARQRPAPGRMHRYGERTGSRALVALAGLAANEWDDARPPSRPLQSCGPCQPLLEPLMQLFWMPAQTASRPASPAAVWLLDVQILHAREDGSAPEKGLRLAAKGGHNAESHNHNDAGHFILQLDGRPAIVDLGRGQYTADTFGPLRYELPFTRGRAHNAPVVGGVEQAAGREFACQEARFHDEHESCRLELDLTAAYPAEARLASLRRVFVFRRNPCADFRVTDHLALREGEADFEIILHAAGPVSRKGPGLLSVDLEPRALLLRFDPESTTANIDTVELRDPWLERNWGPVLHRIRLCGSTRAGRCEHTFRFEAQERPL